MQEADYLIVGAGTAGCLLANRLSRQASVILLEAGGSDRHPWVRVPIGYLRCIGNPRTDWCWSTEAEAGLNGRSLRYPRGRLLGGCSSINGMIYMRGQARDYEAWAELLGDPAWEWKQVLPDFLRHEDHHSLDPSPTDSGPWVDFVSADDATAAGRRLAPAHHGHGGEWRVERQRLHWPILDAVREAALQLGLPARDDFNGGDNEGVGYFEVNQRNGWRWNAAQAFLRPVQHRASLHLRTGVRIDRLLFDDGRCVGVEGQGQTWRPRREVLLCAGAVATPLLLQRSGLGPGALLHSLGIPLRVDLPGVGANLQDHLQLRSTWTVRNVATLNTSSRRWSSRWSMLAEYLFKRSGPLSMAPSQLGIFMRSSPEQRHADLEFHVQPLSLPAFGQPLDPFDAITLSVCHLNPSSRGTIALRSPDPEAPPRIAPNYLSTEADCRTAALALRAVRRLAAQPALAPYAPSERTPGAQRLSDDELIDAARRIGTTIFHPVGTARMGRAGDGAAVLDSHLRVRGVQGLRVVDASAMPLIPSGNTASPTLMIAEKAARWIADPDKEKPA